MTVSRVFKIIGAKGWSVWWSVFSNLETEHRKPSENGSREKSFRNSVEIGMIMAVIQMSNYEHYNHHDHFEDHSSKNTK